MKTEAYLVFFDLRKYSFIEKSNHAEKVIEVLSSMHSVLEDNLLPLNAKLYNLHTDTATYLIEKNEGSRLIEVLKKAKDEVDSMMETMGFPSRLLIGVVFGDYLSGYIKTKRMANFNIFGALMNSLEKHIYDIETSTDKNITEGIVLSEEAFNILNTGKKILKTKMKSLDLIVIE